MIPLFFAPMEGITDEIYRSYILEKFPDWDYVVTDFFRLPTTGAFSSKCFKKHIGYSTLENQSFLDKTITQVLFNDRVDIEFSMQTIFDLGITNLDLNYGCPSKKVNAHKGGAYLLQDLKLLKVLTSQARKSFSGTLSAKVRTGYHNSDNFLEIINILKNEGIDFITVHGRNRDQMYGGRADWDLIRKSASMTRIVGNGDIDCYSQISELEEENIFYGLMIGRGAIANPWMAKEKRENKTDYHDIKTFLNEIVDRYEIREEARLQRIKAFSYYMSNNRELLRSTSISEFFEKLEK